MIHLKSFAELTGKTILRVDSESEYVRNLTIYFTDGSFVVLQSNSCMDTNYHTNFEVKDILSNSDMLDLGFISHEEWTAQEEAIQKQDLQRTLDFIKLHHPELLNDKSCL